MLTSVHVCPSRIPPRHKARTQEEAEKIRNLGLGAIFKNEIRPLVKLDSTTVLRKLNYVDNDALVQLYYPLVLSWNGEKLEHRNSRVTFSPAKYLQSERKRLLFLWSGTSQDDFWHETKMTEWFTSPDNSSLSADVFQIWSITFSHWRLISSKMGFIAFRKTGTAELETAPEESDGVVGLCEYL